MPTAASRRTALYEAPVLQPSERIDPQDALRIAQEHARKEGFEAGYQAGLDLAEAEVTAAIAHHHRAADRLVQAALALEEGHRRLLAADRVVLEEIESDVIELAIALATEVVGRELTVTAQPVRDALLRALQLTPDRRTPTVLVHPDDADAAAEVIAEDPRWGATVELARDARVERGGCVVEVGDCRIDGQIGTAIERIRSALQT